jgi:hypothetical protein
MTNGVKENIAYGSALFMLFFGVALTTAGFIIDPAGQVHDSVLYVLGQCLIFAGSVMGVSAYTSGRMRDIEHKVRHDIENRFRHYEGRQGMPMQMDDYGQEPEPHHCGEDVNEEGGQDETETD